jgi:hypothetical protein
MWVWVWIERVGDLYIGEAYDEHGRELVKISDPISSTAIHDRMLAAGATLHNDCSDIDSALVDADDHANDAQNVARRDYFHLQVRASAGHATAADVSWVAEELKSRASIHPAGSLVRTLASAHATEHEDLIASFLEPSDEWVARTALSALFHLGFADKYMDTLLDWNTRNPPTNWRLRATARWYAGWYISRTPNAKLLRALIEAAEGHHPSTNEVHPVECLYRVLGIEDDRPQGAPPRSHDPAFVAAVLEEARRLLMKWDHEERERGR